MRRGPLLIPLVLLVVVLGACATRTGSGPGDPDPSGTPASTSPGTTPGTGTDPDPAAALPGPVTVIRSGGIAGLRDTVVVRPGGGWQRTAAAGHGKDSTGTLSAAQLAELTALATDPELARESGRTAVSSSCADAFVYSVRSGSTNVVYVDCPNDPAQPAVADKIVRLLLSATSG